MQVKLEPEVGIFFPCRGEALARRHSAPQGTVTTRFTSVPTSNHAVR
jgi:hypothetical protein